MYAAENVSNLNTENVIEGEKYGTGKVQHQNAKSSL